MTRTDWQALNIDEAERGRLYGFGGWLYAFYGIALFRIATLAMMFVGDDAGRMRMFESEANLEIMQWVWVIQILLILPFLILSPLRHPEMPRVTVATWWFAFVLELGVIVVAVPIAQNKVIAISVIDIIYALAFTWYMSRSRRVNLTYRLRVPSPVAS